MTSYPLAQHSWDDDEVITISSKNDQLIGTFPVEFLRHSGLNHWEYIYDVIIQLVDGVQGGVFYTTDGAPICNSDPLRAGDYHYVPQDGQPSLIFTKGPEYFRKNIPPNPNGSQSTRSDSKRSTAQQSAFRISLIARDFACLVTDAPYEECTACHIIPQSRPDIYQSILSIRYPANIFSVSAGLLLRDDIHHAFDRLELSFYFRNGLYYLHFFVLRMPDARRLHGKLLNPDRFRGNNRDRPDPRFIRWHYNQCIKARIRGFAIGMDVFGSSTPSR